jgi:hypothetical protein
MPGAKDTRQPYGTRALIFKRSCRLFPPAEISTLQRRHQDAIRRSELTCRLEEIMMTTRSLAIAVVSLLVSSHWATAQSSQTSDRNNTDLIMGPTARTLKQGQVSIDLPVMVGGPLAEVGLTSRLSIGLGTPVLIPGIRPGSAFLITSKARLFAGRNTDASVGVMHASMAGEGSSGLGYAVVTHGTNDAAVTGGVGFTYSSEGKNPRALVGMLSGEKRVSKIYKLLAEGYMGRGGGILTVGARATRGRVSFDFGLGAFVEDGHHTVKTPVFRISWSS